MIYTSLTVTPLAFSASSSRASLASSSSARMSSSALMVAWSFSPAVSKPASSAWWARFVSPAALQLDVVVDLLDHLLELAGVNAVGAHSGSSHCASQATLWPRWSVVVGAGAKMAMGAMGAPPYGFRRTFAFGRYVAARDWKCGDWARCLSGGLLRRSCPEEGFAVWPLGFGAIMVLRVVH